MSTVPQIQEAFNKVTQAQALLYEAHNILTAMLMCDKSRAIGRRVGRSSIECASIRMALKKHGAPHVK